MVEGRGERARIRPDLSARIARQSKSDDWGGRKTHAADDLALDEGERHGTVISRVGRVARVVSGDPDMTFRDGAPLVSGVSPFAGRVDADGISGQADDALQDLVGRVEGRDGGDEVAALERGQAEGEGRMQDEGAAI